VVDGRDFALDVQGDRRRLALLRQGRRGEAAVQAQFQVPRLDDRPGVLLRGGDPADDHDGDRRQGQCRNKTLAHVLYLSPFRPGP
jgi:hypothetical protein